MTQSSDRPEMADEYAIAIKVSHPLNILIRESDLPAAVLLATYVP